MNLTKKSIQKTSGIHRLGKFYKPGQLVTIDRHVYRITKTNELHGTTNRFIYKTN